MVNFPIPAVRGRIARRLLVNYRVQPEVVAALLPEPFRPKQVRGFALVGICLIRLEDIRPRGLPAAVGLSSENAAHRIAVEWTEQGTVREGVFVLRRHSGSALNCALGGRVFPGLHERASFTAEDDGQRVALRLEGRDGETRVEVAGQRATALPVTSIFRTLEEASEFFRGGSLGWSPAREPGCCEGLELRSATWKADPFAVETARSSFFEAARRFPAGSVEFDCALVMRGIEHEWLARGCRHFKEVHA
jgi:hypothetical protein